MAIRLEIEGVIPSVEFLAAAVNVVAMGAASVLKLGEHTVMVSIDGVAVAGKLARADLIEGGIQLKIATPRPEPTTIPPAGVPRRDSGIK